MSVQGLIQQAKEIRDIVEKFHNEVNENETNSSILNKLKRVDIGIYIIKFLSLGDLCNFRLVCKEFNFLISERVSLISYAKTNSSLFNSGRHIKVELKPLDELRDENDISLQLKFLSKIKKYMSSQNCDIDNLAKLYRVEMDYLKYEDKHIGKIAKKLNETLAQIKNEYEDTKKKTSSILLKKESDSNRNTKNELSEKSIEEIRREIDSLKIEKSKLSNTVYQLEKANKELEEKNEIKTQSLNKIRNFFKIDQEYSKYLDNPLKVQISDDN